MYIDSDTKIQVLDTMSELPRAEKEQCAAFIVRIRPDTTNSRLILVNDNSETSMPSLCGQTALII